MYYVLVGSNNILMFLLNRLKINISDQVQILKYEPYLNLVKPYRVCSSIREFNTRFN